MTLGVSHSRASPHASSSNLLKCHFKCSYQFWLQWLLLQVRWLQLQFSAFILSEDFGEWFALQPQSSNAPRKVWFSICSAFCFFSRLQVWLPGSLNVGAGSRSCPSKDESLFSYFFSNISQWVCSGQRDTWVGKSKDRTEHHPSREIDQAGLGVQED